MEYRNVRVNHLIDNFNLTIIDDTNGVVIYDRFADDRKQIQLSWEIVLYGTRR